MAKESQKYIVVDGVEYDIASGRAIVKKPIQASSHTGVLDLRKPESIRPQSAKEPVHLPIVEPKPIHMPTTKAKPPRAKKTKTKKPKKQKIISKFSHHSVPPAKKLDYFSFVFLQSFWPQASAALWQLNIVRLVLSPQTWLLLLLPLVLLQLRVVANVTLNEALESIKNLSSPANYEKAVYGFATILIFFFVGIITRSVISNSAIAMRVSQIEKEKLRFGAVLRSAAHQLLRQAVNYLFHIAIIAGLLLLSMYVGNAILTSDNEFIVSSKYQLITAIAILWLFSLVILHSKHWLQVGLLARSHGIKHLQMTSTKMLLSSFGACTLSSALSLFASAVVYGSIIATSWYITEYFVRSNSAPTLTYLIAISFYTVVTLCVLSYFSQNLWARQYYFCANKSPKRAQLLYKYHNKPQTLWPFFTTLLIVSGIVVAYLYTAMYFSPQVKGFFANIHAELPSEIKFIVPTRK